MVDLWLKDGKIVPENQLISIGIEEGKIVALKKIAPKREEMINLKEAVILPGLIDAHVHFRDPGLTYKENFRTGTMAAACGGFTTVMDMPNTKPATNTPLEFQKKLKIAADKSLVDFSLHAGVGKLKDIKELVKLNPASFKIFMDLLDEEDIEGIFAEISRLNGKNMISLHCEDKEIINKKTGALRKKEKIKPIIYTEARPPQAEITSISKAISLAGKYNQETHICHITCKESLKLINKAKKDNIRVTCEITPHHLLLNSKYLEKCGNFAKTNPPLRDENDKLDMDDLKNIDIIGTDHAPHTIPEKEMDVWHAPPGIPNLETTLKLLLTQINRHKLSFHQLKQLLCEKPAEIFQLDNKGFIKVGADADFVVLDMKEEGVINPDKFKSKAKYSPFQGFKFKGTPIMTLSHGNVVMDEGEVFNNKGSFV